MQADTLMFEVNSRLRVSILFLLLASCSLNSKRTGGDREVSLSMGKIEALLWTTQSNLDACNTNVLVLTISSDDALEVFTPPTTAKRIRLIVLPTATSGVACKIGKYTFEHDQSVYREVLATTDIGCTAGKCWQHTDNHLSAYVSGVPAAGENWVKQSGDSYVYYKIAATAPQTGSIVFKPGSARITYTDNTKTITVQAAVQQGGRPKAGASVVYTIICPGKDPIVLDVATSDPNGIAQATKVMTMPSAWGNRITAIDSVNLPTCSVSAAINGGNAIDIIADQPAPAAKSGVAIRLTWGFSQTGDYTNAERLKKCGIPSKVTVIGLNGDGTLRRVYNMSNPNEGPVNLLFLPIANIGASCVIDGVTYTIDLTTFDNTIKAADLGCTVNNCWYYRDSPFTHKLLAYDATQNNEMYTPNRGEKWIKRTGDKYVFHIVQ